MTTDAPAADALIAACQSSEAVAELLRFRREGPQAYSAFGDIEVVEKLAEAIVHAGRIALDHLGDGCHMLEYREALGQIVHAAANFIEGWAG